MESDSAANALGAPEQSDAASQDANEEGVCNALPEKDEAPSANNDEPTELASVGDDSKFELGDAEATEFVTSRKGCTHATSFTKPAAAGDDAPVFACKRSLTGVP